MTSYMNDLDDEELHNITGNTVISKALLVCILLMVIPLKLIKVDLKAMKGLTVSINKTADILK